MAIPPQLARAIPEDAAAVVQEFCMMAPGIPWSSQILDDLLSTSGNSIIGSRIEFTPPVGGLTKIDADIVLTERSKKKKIIAFVNYHCGNDNYPNKIEKVFEFDRDGMKAAICFLQETVQNVKRRGLCETCLEGKPATKRLRVGDTGFCSWCLLAKAVYQSP